MIARASPSAAQREVRTARWMVAVIIFVCTVIEIALQLGDLGLAGLPRLRITAYEYGGFWSQLLWGWRPNYALQPWTMFVTYAFLHGGLLHLCFNMAALWSLSPPVAERAGPGGLAAIYAAGVVVGAVAHGLTAATLQPMVGASGGLFGLAGALVGCAHADRRVLAEGIRPTLRAIALLTAINLAMWWALDGQLAWQTHLGGFLAGWIAGRIADRTTDRE